MGDYLEGIKSDFQKAGKVYKSNCDDASHPKSCNKFANYCLLGKGIKQDMDEAYKYYIKGCELGDANSCLHGGLMYVSNSPENVDRPKDYVKVSLKF